MRYYDNPKGMIPTWLINWGAKVIVDIYFLVRYVYAKTIPRLCEIYLLKNYHNCADLYKNI